MRRQWVKGMALTTAVLMGSLAGCANNNSKNSETTEVQTSQNSEGNTATSEGETVAVEQENIKDPKIDELNQVKSWSTIKLKDNTSTSSDNTVKISDDNKITIKEGGYYTVSGSLSNGQLVVKTDKDAKVYIKFDGVSINNADKAPVRVKSAGEVTIFLADGSENKIVCGKECVIDKNYTVDDIESNEDENAANAINSDCNLSICGNGSLEVFGYAKQAIHSKGVINISSGNISVTAFTNGIKGNEAVNIKGGNIKIFAGNDGIKADDKDKNAESGSVGMLGGRVNITCFGDGVQAESDINVSGGDIMLKTGMDVADITKKENNRGWDKDDEGAVSVKGLKAGGNINISNGRLTAECEDDAVHSIGSLVVSGGEIKLATGDDAFHAGKDMTVSAGSIEVLDSYEGIEAVSITLNGGEIHLKTDDDGINADGETAVGNTGVIINDGELFIDAEGDGIDSNGNITINGGMIVIDGPTNGKNGALDNGSENGGSLIINGGTLLAIGASDVAKIFGDMSSQCAFSMEIEFDAGDELKVFDADDRELFKHSVLKKGSNIVFSSPSLAVGSKYSVKTGETTAEQIELDAMISIFN